MNLTLVTFLAATILGIVSSSTTDFNCVGHCVPSVTPAAPLGDCFALTPDEKRKAGAVWSTCPLNIADSFTVSASLYLGDKKDRGGADGMGFVIQNTGSTIIGHYGGGLGMKGITPSVGVEFDTFKNTRDTLATDHIAVVRDGRVFRRIIDGPVPFPGDQNVEDGAFHDVVIEWVNSTMTLNVYWEGNSTALMSTHVDLVSIFDSGSAYVGFTGATGNKTNLHEVCVQRVMGTIAPILAPTSISPSVVPKSQSPIVMNTVSPIVALPRSPSIQPSGTFAPSVTEWPSLTPTVVLAIVSDAPSLSRLA